MTLSADVRESLVMALDEYLETENDDPDASELAEVFVRLLVQAAEENDVDNFDELPTLIEEEAELDEPLAHTLEYEFGKNDDLELAGEEVVLFVEKLGLLDWESDEDDDDDDLDF